MPIQGPAAKPASTHLRRGGQARWAPAAFAVSVATMTAVLGLAGCSEAGAPPLPPNAIRPTGAQPPITVNGLRPITVMPSDVRDWYGARVAALVHRGLMRYDLKGKAVLEVAESVATDDDRVFLVKLRKEQMFSTGELITANTFMASWNWVADPKNQQSGAAALSPIAGWDRVRSGQGIGNRKPTLYGLRAVDPLTLRITLTQPTRDFTAALSELALVPLPANALIDPKGFAASPVGNGPYRLEGAWQRRQYLTLAKSPIYRGDDAARNAGLVFRYLSDRQAMYPALRAGSLDVIDAIPLGALPTYRDELKLKGVNQPVGVTQSLAFPVRRSPWNTPSGLLLRRAIAQGIDRDGLITQYFAQTRQRATGLAAPVVEGYSEGTCGDWCAHNPTKAKTALVAAGGFTGTLQVAYSQAQDDGAWVSALCASLTEALGIRCQPLPYPDDASYLSTIASGKMAVPFVATTRMSTPNLAGFITPRFAAGSPVNDTGYASARVQALIARGSRPDQDAIAPFLEAERQLLKDLPVIPLWTRNATGGSGEDVEGLKFDVFGQPVYTELNRS